MAIGIDKTYGGCLKGTPNLRVDGDFIIDDNTSIFLLSTDKRKVYYQVKNGVVFEILKNKTGDSCELTWDDEKFTEPYMQIGDTKYYLGNFIVDGDEIKPAGNDPAKKEAGLPMVVASKCIHGEREGNIPYCIYFRLLVIKRLYNAIKSNKYTLDDFLVNASRFAPEWIIYDGEGEPTMIQTSELETPMTPISLKAVYDALVNTCAVEDAIKAANAYFNPAGLNVECVSFNMESDESDDGGRK